MLVSLTGTLQAVKKISPKIDLTTGLLKSPVLSWVEPKVATVDAEDQIRRNAPVDGREIVEWMQVAAAINSVFEGYAEEYKRAGSFVFTRSGDAYIPGLTCGSLRPRSEPGAYVLNRGYAIVYTPRGSFNIPVNGKSTFAKLDLLAWGALPYCGRYQWTPALAQWHDLARTPISRRVRFVNCYGKVAPNFFIVSSRIPSPMLITRIGLTSDKKQRVQVRGRSTDDYGIVHFSDEIEIPDGESETVYMVTGIPYVRAFVLELQPEDNTNTILDFLDAIP